MVFRKAKLYAENGHHLPFFLGICSWAEAGTYFDLLFVNLFMNTRYTYAYRNTPCMALTTTVFGFVDNRSTIKQNWPIDIASQGYNFKTRCLDLILVHIPNQNARKKDNTLITKVKNEDNCSQRVMSI